MTSAGRSPPNLVAGSRRQLQGANRGRQSCRAAGPCVRPRMLSKRSRRTVCVPCSGSNDGDGRAEISGKRTDELTDVVRVARDDHRCRAGGVEDHCSIDWVRAPCRVAELTRGASNGVELARSGLGESLAQSRLVRSALHTCARAPTGTTTSRAALAAASSLAHMQRSFRSRPMSAPASRTSWSVTAEC